MAYQFVAANSQRLVANLSWSSYPISIDMNVMLASTATEFSLLRLQNSGSDDMHYFSIGNPLNRGWEYQVQSSNMGFDSAGFSVANGGTLDTNQHHICCVSSGLTSHKIYVDGYLIDTDTNSTNPFNFINSLSIGAKNNKSSNQRYSSSDIANVSIWSAALTDAEITSLAKGFKPTRIRPQSLVFYAPLLRNLQDLRAGLALTPQNSPTVADHPRVY